MSSATASNPRSIQISGTSSGGDDSLSSSFEKINIRTPAEKLVNRLFKKIDPLLSSFLLGERIAKLIAEYAVNQNAFCIGVVLPKAYQRTITVMISPDDTVADLKQSIRDEEERINFATQSIVFHSRHPLTEDTKKLGEYPLKAGDMVHIIAAVRG